MLFKSYAVITSSVLTLASAAVTPLHQEKKPLKLEFSVLRGDSTSDAGKNKHAELVKRKDGQESLTLTNTRSYYQVDLALGSNNAKCSLLIDTGSSDLWVMSSDVKCAARRLATRGLDDTSRRRVFSFDELVPIDNSKEDKPRLKKRETITLEAGDSFPTEYASLLGGLASQYESELGGSRATLGLSNNAVASACTALGSFNTASSESFKRNSSAPDFSITYADGTYAKGIWGQDSVDFTDFKVPDVSFAVVDDTSSSFGVLGIGLEGLETTFSSNKRITQPYTYENLPVRMKRTGAINKVLYSLYLAESSASKGSILFGAVDHAKYSGQLQTVPLVNIYPSSFKNPVRLDIALNSIDLQSNSQNVSISNSRIAALLDSGTTLSYLPRSILTSLIGSLDGTYSSLNNLYQVNCAYNTNSAFVVFNFSGVDIKVPLSDLIINQGSSTCFLGVLEQKPDATASFPYAILGDNFIRNAYVVYDLEDYEVSLAQAKYTTDEDIEVVSSSVPRASKAPGYSSTSLVTSATGSSSSELNSSGFKRSAGVHSASISKVLALIMAVSAFIAII